MLDIRNLKDLTPGDSFTFGRYPQTAAGDDETPVRWTVTAADGEYADLVSLYVLDLRRCYNSYSNEYPDGHFLIWERTELRAWLQTEFAGRAFSAAERAVLRPQPGFAGKTESDRRMHGPSGIPDDIVSLPDSGGKAFLTGYAAGIRSWYDEGDACAWWTREIGPGRHSQIDQCVIDENGESGFRTASEEYGVRPKIRLYLPDALPYAADLIRRVLPLDEADPQPGSLVSFGRDPETGHPLSWITLERRKDSVLLLSEKSLGERHFDEQPEYEEHRDQSEYVPWEQCSLRGYMNGPLLQRLFTDAEQARVLCTRLDNGADACHPCELRQDPDTEDRLFALGWKEGMRYRHLLEEDQDPDWWLRSPGGSGACTGGSLSDDSCPICYGDWLPVMEACGVRPAVQVRLTDG